MADQLNIRAEDATPKLSIAIATHGESGALNVERMNLPRIEGVEYVVSWQRSGDAPVPEGLAARDDVRIYRFGIDGLSANRNNAVAHTRGDFILMGDDDLEYDAEGLQRALQTMLDAKDVDFFVFRFIGAVSRWFPDEETSLRPMPKNFNVTCFQLAVRRSAWFNEQRPLRFNTAFGPGAPRFTAGEDNVLLYNAIELGFNARYYPITIARHPQLTTGERVITDYGVTQTIGAMVMLQFPATCALRIPLIAFRLTRQGRASFFSSLINLCSGATYALLHKKELTTIS